MEDDNTMHHAPSDCSRTRCTPPARAAEAPEEKRARPHPRLPPPGHTACRNRGEAGTPSTREVTRVGEIRPCAQASHISTLQSDST